MGAPLSPHGSLKEDLLFWLKEYAGRKISTLSFDPKSEEGAKRVAELRRKIKKPEATIGDIDKYSKEMSSLGFKELRNYIRPAIDFIGFCVDEIKIQQITDISGPLILEDYFGSRHFNSPKTKVNQYRSVVGFIGHIEKNNVIDDRGASFQFGLLKMPTSFKASEIPGTLFPEEFERFVEYLNSDYQSKSKKDAQRNRLMMKLLCYMGIRVSELTSLTRKSFNSKDADGYYPVKVRGKGKKERVVYLKGSLVDDDLVPWLERHSDRLFQISNPMVYIIVSTALKMAGVQKEKMGPHLLRHSYATYLLASGVGLAQIQKLLGHASIETTTIYAKVMDREIKDAARVF